MLGVAPARGVAGGPGSAGPDPANACPVFASTISADTTVRRLPSIVTWNCSARSDGMGFPSCRRSARQRSPVPPRF